MFPKDAGGTEDRVCAGHVNEALSFWKAVWERVSRDLKS